MDEREFTRLSRFYADRVMAHDDRMSGYRDRWADMTAALLRHGGSLVVPPREPEDDETLTALATPTIWPGSPVRLVTGRANACHANTADLFLIGEVDTIATGYALSDDELWRQHTWGVRDGVVVETTVARERYAGVHLDGRAAFTFALANTTLDLEDVAQALAAVLAVEDELDPPR